jgi:hypothetical protein
LRLGQERFAKVLSIPVAVVRRWEREHMETDPAVQALLRILNRIPVPAKKEIGVKRKSALTEAIDRAEATALLMRCEYRVYRPEADVDGEDLVLRTPPPDAKLIAVQLKAFADVDDSKYGKRNIWMLFPSGPSSPRAWYLIPHDPFFEWVKGRHGHTKKWKERWHYTNMPREWREFLRAYEIKLPSIIERPEVSTELS